MMIAGFTDYYEYITSKNILSFVQNRNLDYWGGWDSFLEEVACENKNTVYRLDVSSKVLNDINFQGMTIVDCRGNVGFGEVKTWS